jgi:hypothetical protein
MLRLTLTDDANRKAISFFSQFLLVLIAFFLSPISALAQLPVPDEIPNDFTSPQRQELSRKRAGLLQERQDLLGRLQNHNQKCSSVPKGTEIAQECAAAKQQLLAAITAYGKAVGDLAQSFSATQASASGPSTGLLRSQSCEMIAHQVQLDREEIERQIRTRGLSQQELSDWNKLNAKAQTDAVMAGAKFVMGEFVADIDPVRSSVSRLESQAAELAQKGINSKKSATRVRYLAQLSAALDHLEPIQGNLMDKIIVQTGDDAEKFWDVTRNTMRHEFRVAAKHNEEMRKTLQGPEFKEAFTGDDIDTPGLDVLTVLTEQAGEETGKFMLGLSKYERFTGPTIRAAEFVRDAAYNALLSYVSTQRVIQQSDLAGDLAKSAGLLQQRYKNSVDALAACRQVRSSD